MLVGVVRARSPSPSRCGRARYDRPGRIVIGRCTHNKCREQQEASLYFVRHLDAYRDREAAPRPNVEARELATRILEHIALAPHRAAAKQHLSAVPADRPAGLQQASPKLTDDLAGDGERFDRPRPQAAAERPLLVAGFGGRIASEEPLQAHRPDIAEGVEAAIPTCA